MKRLKQSFLSFLFFFFISLPAQAQAQASTASLNLPETIRSLYTTAIKPLFPLVLGIVFVVSAMMNIGDIWGEHKNWKGFLSKVGLYVGICLLLIVVVNFIFALSL